MISEAQIREKLGRYLRHDLSLDLFEDWLAQQSWNMHKDSSEAAQKLASAIELRLGEYSSGHLEEASLREDLRQFANPSVIQVSFDNVLPREADEPSNNRIIQVDSSVIVFTSHWEASPAATFPAGSEVSGTRQLVVPA